MLLVANSVTNLALRPEQNKSRRTERDRILVDSKTCAGLADTQGPMRLVKE